MDRFSVKYVESSLGIPRSLVTAFVRAGFIAPARGPRRAYELTFQDIVILRMGQHLASSKIAPRKLMQALRRLRQRLPAELPLNGLRITAIGSDIAIREGTHWQSPSGQYLLDLEVTAVGASVRFLNKSPEDSAEKKDALRSAENWFAAGCAIEAQDPREAKAAYRRCIELDPRHGDAYLNLGHLLQNEGRNAEACALYRKAIDHRAANSQLHFNLAVALEDTEETAAALAAYAECIALDPTFADAHYNAARLHERLGHSRQAIRHYSEYRRLQAGP